MIVSEYNEIVRHELKECLGHPLPRGIYAGAAISSIVLGKIWNRDIPVNDRFELYQNYPDPVEDDLEFVMRYTGAFKEGARQKEGYTVLSTQNFEEKVIINIYYDTGTSLGNEKRALHVLRGLGVNALQVAYYACGPGEGSLYATDAFLEFTKSKQIRVTCPVFGMSFLHLAKYQDLYNAYIDWDEEALLMSGFRKSGTSVNSKVCDDLLTIEDKLLFDKHKEKLARYCVIDELTEPALPGLEGLMQSKWKIYFNHPDSLSILSAIQQAHISGGYSINSYTYSQIFDVLIRKSTRAAIKKRFLTALTSPEASYVVMNEPKYLKNDFDGNHLMEIDKFNSCHPSAMKIIKGLHNDFVSQVKTIRLLKKLGRIHGSPDFVIGLVERARNYGIELKEITEVSVNKLVVAYASIGSSPMIDTVDLSQFKYRDAVVELTSSDALMLEGLRCSNCIGGYHGEVVESAGNMRIFHINTPGSSQHSTAMICNHGTDDLGIDYEVSGPGNTDASEEHNHITIELAYFLRDTIWKPETPEVDQAFQSGSTD